MRHLAVAAAAANGSTVACTPVSSAGGRRKRICVALESPAAGAGCNSNEPVNPALSLDTLVARKERLDACRWFYEMLVLSNNRLVDLSQQEPFGEITVTPNLAAMAAR